MAFREPSETNCYPTGYHACMRIGRSLLIPLLGFTLVASSCGSDEPATEATDAVDVVDEAADSDAAAIKGFATISAQDAAAIADDPPAELVVLDVRTPEEFAEGHLEGAVLVDFYDADFAEQLTALDPEVPYLVYCRSGNRSGQTLSIMQDLGFESAVDVDGGIVAWAGSGLPVAGG